MTTVSRSEVDALKRDWLGDPIYDIAEVGSEPGWEPYAEELKTFQEAQKKLWSEARTKAVQDKADALGITNNPTLAAYIMRLEARIEQLSRDFDRHANGE